MATTCRCVPGARRWRTAAAAAQDEDRAVAMDEHTDERLTRGRAGPLRAVQPRPTGPREPPQPGLLAATAGGGGRSRRACLRWRPDPSLERGASGSLPGGPAAGDGGQPALPPGGTETIDGRGARAESAILALRLASGIDRGRPGRPGARGRASPGRIDAGLVRADGRPADADDRAAGCCPTRSSRGCCPTPRRSPIGVPSRHERTDRSRADAIDPQAASAARRATRSPSWRPRHPGRTARSCCGPSRGSSDGASRSASASTSTTASAIWPVGTRIAPPTSMPPTATRTSRPSSVSRAAMAVARLLPLLDRDAIGANPKPLCGYSDITMLHLAIEAWTEPGTISFYSNGASGVGWPRPPTSRGRTMHRALFSDEPYGPIPPDPDDPYVRTITGGTARGRLTGGCLDLVQTTLGTPIEIDTRGRIVYLEDLDMGAYQLDGGLTTCAMRASWRRRRASSSASCTGSAGGAPSGIVHAGHEHRGRPEVGHRAARCALHLRPAHRPRQAPRDRAPRRPGDPGRGRRHARHRRGGHRRLGRVGWPSGSRGDVWGIIGAFGPSSLEARRAASTRHPSCSRRSWCCRCRRRGSRRPRSRHRRPPRRHVELSVQAASTPPLPACAHVYKDIKTRFRDLSQWRRTLVDTRLRVGSAYKPKDLVSVSQANIGGSGKVRAHHHR